MKVLLPSPRDLWDLKLAINSFKDAYGSVNHVNAVLDYRESINPAELWMHVPIEKDDIDVLLDENEIILEDKNLDNEILESSTHILSIRFYKMKIGFRKTCWLGSVFFMFSSKEIYLGAISSIYQAEMWDKLRNILYYTDKFYSDEQEALQALLN